MKEPLFIVLIAARWAQIMELVDSYLVGLSPEYRAAWERRLKEDAALVEWAVEEARIHPHVAPEDRVKYANKVYLTNVRHQRARNRSQRKFSRLLKSLKKYD